jgi:hypothetical protein
MTIKKVTKHMRPTQASAKVTASMSLPRAEVQISNSNFTKKNESPIIYKRDNISMTPVNIINNSVLAQTNFSNLAPAQGLNSSIKLFKNTDSIRTIIKNLRRQSSKIASDEDTDFMNYLVPNVGIKLP